MKLGTLPTQKALKALERVKSRRIPGAMVCCTGDPERQFPELSHEHLSCALRHCNSGCLQDLLAPASRTRRQTEIRGLKEFAPEERPNSTIVFWSFRIMVGMGLLMLLLGVIGLVLRLRNKLYDARWFQRFALALAPSGLIALLAGWITTEVGRQPWVVYGVLRTAATCLA